jgi:hypothetical protein
VRYGLGVLGAAARYRLQRWGVARFRIFDDGGAPK